MEQYSPRQIKKYIKQLRQREDQYVHYLGQLAYQEGERGGLEGPLLDAYRSIKDIRAEISRWEEYLERLRAARSAPGGAACPRCGNLLVPGAPQCAYCGQPVAVYHPGPVGIPHAGSAPHGLPYGPGVPPGPVSSPGGIPADMGSAPVVPGAQAQAQAMSPQAPTGPKAGIAGGSPASTDMPTPPGIPVQPQPEKTQALKCPRCGGGLRPDALFCGHCGSKVEPSAGVAVTEAGEVPGAGKPPEEPSHVAAPGVGTPGLTAGGQGSAQPPVPVEDKEADTGVPAGQEAGVIACKGCGTVVDEPDAVFCPECGARLRG